jgi:hypothetical protein
MQQADMADARSDRVRIDARAADELEKSATARLRFGDFAIAARETFGADEKPKLDRAIDQSAGHGYQQRESVDS